MVNYTYKTEETWIDHTFANFTKFKDLNTVILVDENILSDHYPLLTETIIKPRPIRLNTAKKVEFLPGEPVHKLQEFTFRLKLQSETKSKLVEIYDELIQMYSGNANEEKLGDITRDLDTYVSNTGIYQAECARYTSNYI